MNRKEPAAPPTAAIIIIGNEILSGKVEDANSHFLATELRDLGVDVRRISVIPDEVDAVAGEVAKTSRDFDYVFTSGGVGPTHDDVTMEGIAKAFGRGTVTNSKILEQIKKRCGGSLEGVTTKMAEIPEGAEIIDIEGMFPPVVIGNVYIFPGIPEFLRRKFLHIKERFRSAQFVLRKVFVNEEECYIAHHLDRVAAEFPSVAVGSYPKVGSPEYKVMVTLESTDSASLGKALELLLKRLPGETVVRSE